MSANPGPQALHPTAPVGTAARIGDLKQVAAVFGISESCPTNWMRTADVQDGIAPGTTAAEKPDLREARKRVRLLEQEDEVLRRAAAHLSQANLTGELEVPARAWARRCRYAPIRHLHRFVKNVGRGQRIRRKRTGACAQHLHRAGSRHVRSR